MSICPPYKIKTLRGRVGKFYTFDNFNSDHVHLPTLQDIPIGVMIQLSPLNRTIYSNNVKGKYSNRC
ncbi:MAG: hypothetical protein F6K50_02030 [Moorea sp. SIO3I7]|uniref:hypothetical protein n=1 Tax=unclassified Moorena TaxID=2683338 RepID=UPI0013BFA453|nr:MULTISPECIES: hypothetical protein [unclassified Moorena]NEN94346.1 hypothetical protein [Moorena sp. SIO3I7]NEO06239.1 hypothetical protein [Moorena sp. SIO3I8]NEP25147.1 hypothetical protein [Moorena sp. SIO3I6]